jgi:hypothetical protein
LPGPEQPPKSKSKPATNGAPAEEVKTEDATSDEPALMPIITKEQQKFANSAEIHRLGDDAVVVGHAERNGIDRLEERERILVRRARGGGQDGRRDLGRAGADADHHQGAAKVCDQAEIHRLGDDAVVVGHAERNGIDRLEERERILVA